MHTGRKKGLIGSQRIIIAPRSGAFARNDRRQLTLHRARLVIPSTLQRLARCRQRRRVDWFRSSSAQDMPSNGDVSCRAKIAPHQYLSTADEDRRAAATGPDHRRWPAAHENQDRIVPGHLLRLRCQSGTGILHQAVEGIFRARHILLDRAHLLRSDRSFVVTFRSNRPPPRPRRNGECVMLTSNPENPHAIGDRCRRHGGWAVWLCRVRPAGSRCRASGV